MFKSKSSRLALMAVAFALPVVLGERAPAPEQATAEAPAAESPAPRTVSAPAAAV